MKYLLIILALTLTASARYNETEKQCTERYGKPVSSTATKASYKVKNIKISCSFFNGKCYKISYTEYRYSKVFLDVKGILKLYGITKIKVPVFIDGKANEWFSKDIKDFHIRGTGKFLEIKNLKIEALWKESLKSTKGNTEGL